MAAAITPASASAASGNPALSPPATLTARQAAHIFVTTPKVASWLKRYPKHSISANVNYREGIWSVRVLSGDVGIAAAGAVIDRSHAVPVAWTGPQVAWPMARGTGGSFGGKYLNSIPVFLGFAVAFFIGLADWRRPWSVRNLDLLVLLSFGVSLSFFDRGHIFSSVSLAYPPLFYLLARMIWIGIRGRAPRAARPIWPVWPLAAVVVFAFGFRIAFDLSDTSPVIDVGYAGVIGAQRVDHGQMPYGHMPVTTTKPCGSPDVTGNVANYIQTNGRCENVNAHGDTYGPISYQAYLPGYWIFGWKGASDTKLNAGRFTSILFDSLCVLGLALVGWRFGRWRLGVTLAFAWVTYPFTQYALNSNTNDMVQAAFLIFALLFIATPFRRGFFGALASWVKFAPLIIMPMWLTYPDLRSIRPKLRFVAGFAIATLLAFWILLLEPNPIHAASVFFNRALRWQIGRDSPFSLWDWRQYHAAGIPNLHAVQVVLSALLVAGALAAAVWPRHKSLLQLVALTGALLIGFELVQTHWFYLYIPWFLPFVFLAILAPPLAPQPADRRRAPEVQRMAPELAGIG